MSDLSHEQLTALLRYSHPEKTNPALTETAIAALFNIPVELWRQIKSECAAATRQAAAELLAEPDVAARVARLPFAPGSTIVGLGDSITDDWHSWLEILRALLDIQRPNDHFRVVNAGISGQTTTQMFYRVFYDIAAEKPDWIICIAGTNDARRYGDRSLKPEVSPEETEKNLAQLRDFATTRTSARWVWMTPTPVIPDRIRSHGNMAPGLIWMHEDVTRVADIVRRQKDPVVELQHLFGVPPKPDYLFDGLHPSLEGQKLIARALLEALT